MDGRLNEPCPAWGLNLGPVVWKRDTLATQPLGFVDFLQRVNPQTCAGVELATLGTKGQRQTNQATQPA
ncbi:hypothetical protein TNCV_1397821 [Trichonephila clavipes]|nr:hypothetical protein TNCV_1397821 [Trichonephila clavipes]